MEYSYEDNGDGTFSEVANDVDDYGYVTRTRSVPVYRAYFLSQTEIIH